MVRDAAVAVSAVLGVNAAITRTRDAINILASLDDAAQKTGSSIEDLSRIEQTARNFGDAFGPVEQSISRLAKGLAEINDPSNDAVRALDAINVSARDNNGQLRTAADVYIDVAKSLQNYRDGAEKTAVANALFGKSGAELLPVLNNIAQGIDGVSGVSEQSARQADEFNNAMARSSSIVNELFTGLAIDLLPTLNNIVNTINTSTGSVSGFSSVSSVAVAIMKGLAIAGRAVVDVFADVGREIGGRAAQLTALASLDFKGAGFIGEQISKDFIQSRVDFDQFVDTILNGDKKIAEVATDGGIKKTIDFAMKMPEALKPATAATRSSIDASQTFLEKLESEAEQLGKTNIEIRKMEAAKLGLSKVADPLIDQIEGETAAAKQLEAQLRKVESITQANMTADEKFGQTIEELNRLMQLPEGGLSPEVYSRAVQKAQDELESSINATKQTGKEASNEWSDIWRNAESTAKNAFVQFAAHGKNAMESIGESIKFYLIDALYQLTVRKWIINVGATLGLGGGIGGTGSPMSMGGFGGGMTLASMLGKNPSQSAAESFALKAWGNSGASGGTGMMARMAGGMGGMSAGGALGALGVMAASVGVGSSIAGDKEVLGIDGTTAAIMGAAMGGPVGAVVAGAINALFGRSPYKFRQQSLQGTASSDGFDGDFTNVFRSKGGLLTGNKHKSLNQDLTQEQQDVFDIALDGFYGSAHKFAENMGLNVDLVDGFTREFQIKSEKNQQLTSEAVSEMLAGVGDDIAKNVLPMIDTFRKAGETSFKTLERLSSEFTALEQGAMNLGASAAYAKELVNHLSIETRSAYVEAAGGSEEFLALTAKFNQNFLTEAEQMAPAIKLVEEGLTSLGIAANISKDEFGDLIQTLIQSASDADKLKALLMLQNQDLFLAVDAYKEKLREVPEVTKAVADALLRPQSQILGEAFSTLQRSVEAERTKITDKFSKEMAGLDTQIQNVTASIGKLRTFSDSLKSTVNDPQPMERAFAKNIVQNAIKNGNFDTPQLGFAIDRLKDQSTSGFKSSFEFAREQAKSVSLLTDLGAAADAQISEQQLLLAEFNNQRATLEQGFNSQVERLNSIVEQGQKQVELLGGINSSLLTVGGALANFNLPAVQGGGTAIKDPLTGSTPMAPGNTNISNQAIIDYFKTQRTAEEIYRDAKKDGISSQQIINTGRFTQADVDKFFKDNPNIPKFASGGLHRGGVRIVGERGPEIEFTGPSRIASNSDMKKTLGNDQVIGEIILLRQEMAKVVKTLNAVTQGGTALRTKSA